MWYLLVCHIFNERGYAPYHIISTVGKHIQGSLDGRGLLRSIICFYIHLLMFFCLKMPIFSPIPSPCIYRLTIIGQTQSWLQTRCYLNIFIGKITTHEVTDMRDHLDTKSIFCLPTLTLSRYSRSGVPKWTGEEWDILVYHLIHFLLLWRCDRPNSPSCEWYFLSVRSDSNGMS